MSPFRETHDWGRPQAAPSIERRIRTAAWGMAAACVVLGVLAYLLWFLDIRFFQSVGAGYKTLPLDTALGFILSGLSLGLILWGGKSARVGAGLGILVSLLGMAGLLQELLGLDFRIDHFLLMDRAEPVADGDTGRMSWAAALAFLFSGLALASLSEDRRLHLGQRLATAVLVLTLLVVVGYLFGVESLYAVPSMAVPAALGFLLLTLGILGSRPEVGFLATLTRDSSGSMVGRRLLPLAVVTPLALGAILAVALGAFLVDAAFALAAVSVMSAILLVWVIWWMVRTVDAKERQITAERRHFETTLTSIDDGVIVTDETGRVLFLNPEAHRLTGWSGPEAHGRPLGEVFVLLDEDTGEVAQDPAGKVQREEARVALVEHAVLRGRDGVERPIEDSAAPINDDLGRRRGAVLVFRDVSAKRVQQRKLEESEERFRLTADAAPVLIWMSDVEQQCTWVNQRWLRFVGRTMEQEAGRGWMENIHPDDFDRCMHTHAHTFDSRREFVMEYRLRRHDGEYRWMLDTGVPRYDADGSFAGFIGSCLDITEQKEIEEALRRKTAELEAEDRRKEMFLATLGHEIRNPLSALVSAVRLAERGVEDPQRLHGMMAAHVDHLTTLVDDLLEISRVTRGKITLRKSRIDLTDVVRSATESVRNSIRAKEQRLFVSGPKSLSVHGDTTRLGQVVSNLLSNASKFTPKGGRIEVELTEEDGQAAITVRDEGRGLQAEQAEAIFQPFVQEDPGGGGLGIGLALVKGLVELHGGSVGVHSPGPGRGSAFTIRIPQGETTGDEVEPPVSRSSPRQLPGSSRILIIDDLRDAADLMALLLGSLGATTRSAYTGAEGLETIRTWRPDVALVDIGLPDMSGYRVAEIIRAEEAGHDLLLLAVTGFGDPAAEERALAAGFDARLLKPLDHERLHDLLCGHLSRNRSRGEPDAPRADSTG